jgi:transcriptional regulator with XRE-family HTH domain
MAKNERLIAARVARNLSQTELADTLNIPRRSLNRWERTGKLPNPGNRRKLCDFFRMSLEQLGFEWAEAESTEGIQQNGEQQGDGGSHRHRLQYRVIAVLGVIAIVFVSVATSVFLLQRHETPQRSDTPQEIYNSAVSRNPDFQDPLAKQDANMWDEVGTSEGGCAFVDGAYRLTMNQGGHFQVCEENAKSFGDFVYEVQMTILQGDGGGITFRDSANTSNMYRVRVGADGSYDIVASFFVNPFAPKETQHVFTSGRKLSVIHTGFGKTNTVGVVARGKTITLFVNGQPLASLIDPSPDAGLIGLMAVDFSHQATVKFTNVKVWSL